MLIFIDVQTTGLEVKDKIISMGLVAVEDEQITTMFELVNEGKKVPSIASSINHITTEMLKNKVNLKDSETYKFLLKHNRASSIIIGHNVKFDLSMLQNAGFSFLGEVIDTLRVTKHLVPECEMFSLQFLRYELKLYKKEEKSLDAYNALDNAKVVKNLYEYLKEMDTKRDFTKLSFQKVLLEKFEFGKYSGRYIEEISMCDRGYLEWMLSYVVDLDEDLRYSIEYHLGSIL
ncbi:exonuclease domain-containing protein [Sulfurimonas sp.]|uniref:exonuclease domain-containing protein n=1 Tax=Sulfurimonas sp. TaxID=2022749 RepID=UPI002AAFD3AC|nr:exonuclease domain-containing protein [Sulfurimonas sp.]